MKCCLLIVCVHWMAVQGPVFGGSQWDAGDADQRAVGQEEPKWSYQSGQIPWYC